MAILTHYNRKREAGQHLFCQSGGFSGRKPGTALRRKQRGRKTYWNLAGRQNGSFRASAHTGVGIPIEFWVAYRHTNCSFAPFSGIRQRKIVLLSRRLPHQRARWFAMTENSLNSNLNIQRARQVFPAGRKKARIKAAATARAAQARKPGPWGWLPECFPRKV